MSTDVIDLVSDVRVVGRGGVNEVWRSIKNVFPRTLEEFIS